jgi:type IV pilus assembly protein PilF
MNKKKLAAYAAFLVAMVLGLQACGGTGTRDDDRPKSPKDAAKYNLQLGMAYLERNELQFAREKIDKALRQDASNPDAHRAAALLYDRVGQADTAERHYETALRLKPNDPLILNNYGVFLCRHGKVDKGEARFLQSAQSPFNREPENAYSNAGTCMRGAQRYQEANAYFEKALAVRPKHRDALLQIAEMSFEQKRYDESRAGLMRYIERVGATAEILWLGVRLERAAGNLTQANTYARRLRTEYPTSEQTRALIASERTS